MVLPAQLWPYANQISCQFDYRSLNASVVTSASLCTLLTENNANAEFISSSNSISLSSVCCNVPNIANNNVSLLLNASTISSTIVAVWVPILKICRIMVVDFQTIYLSQNKNEYSIVASSSCGLSTTIQLDCWINSLKLLNCRFDNDRLIFKVPVNYESSLVSNGANAEMFISSKDTVIGNGAFFVVSQHKVENVKIYLMPTVDSLKSTILSFSPLIAVNIRVIF